MWVLVTFGGILAALHVSWPAPPGLPSTDQVAHARSVAWTAAAVSVTPLVSGLFLAGRWRLYEWAIALGVLLMVAVLGSALLVALADG